MEHDEVKKFNTDIIEEAEISDSDGDYTPLQRPGVVFNLHELPNKHHQQDQIEQQQQQLKETKMDDVVEYIEDSLSDFGVSSDSSSDSDDVIYAVKSSSNDGQLKRKQNKKRTKLLRIKPKQDNDDGDESKQKHKNKFKKYNIWAASLQEESLTENMRGIDVNKYPKNDRNVESYDFNLKYRLERKNGSGGFKRRMPSNHSGDDFSDITYSHQNKRSKHNFGNTEHKSTIKNILGRRDSISSSCDSQNFPRFILDLNVSVENNNMEIARDIANKLCEEKDILMIRAVEILGKETLIEIFKETQRVERDGGMMVMNGNRRRTPGGVFLFLIKNHDNISAEDKELIFRNEAKQINKQRKKMMSMKRDKKVEELKKQLSLKEKELPALSKRIDITTASNVCHLKADTHTNLSNPPPSPVTNGGLENSPDYSLHAINHVNYACPGKSTARTIDDENLVSYDDNIIEMNYSDMDLF